MRRCLRPICGFVGLLLIAGCAGSQRDTATQAVTVENLRAGSAPHSGKPTALELQARLMSYADRYLAKAAEATDVYQRQIKTREAREFGISTFIFPGLAAIGIAAGDDPASNLLDLVVLASLQRAVIEDGWAREILGDPTSRNLIAVQRDLEQQAWAIAADVLTPAQQATLRQTLADWRKANPHQRYVSNVRFDEVAVVRGRGQGRSAALKTDGFLAPLDQAVRESQALRLLAERGIYLMQRMPPLMLAQTRYVMHEQVSPEQLDGLMKDFAGISRSLAGAERTVAAVPDVIARERKALFKAFDQHEMRINATLDRVAPTLTAGRGMTGDIKDTLAAVENIARLYPVTGAVLNETIARYKDLMMATNGQPPSDLAPKIEALRLLAAIGGEANRLAVAAERLPLNELKALAEETYTDFLDALLWRALALAAAILSLLFAYRYAARRYLVQTK